MTVKQQADFTNTSAVLDSAKTVTIEVVNHAANDQPVVYQNTSASLTVTLTNQTGHTIALTSGDQLEVYMPLYFTAGEVSRMTIIGISQPGWTFTADQADGSLLLSWGTTAGTWTSGTSLKFTINNVVSANVPTSDFVQVNFNAFTGSNIPTEVSAALTLMTPPVQGNADLQSVLQVKLEFDGLIYCSTADNMLQDSLTLTIKNVGGNSLYNGTQQWSGNPRVIVRFVYGSTTGALAPADKSSASDESNAWSFTGAVSDDEGNAWSASNPDATGDSPSPSWIFSPAQSNTGIIGTGADANIIFQFNNIFSLTPSGATQMYVLFTGFAQDENTPYNDALFVCDIAKLDAPSTQGLQKFYPVPSYSYTTAKGSVPGTSTINLFWTCFQVASVDLTYSIFTGTIPPPPPVSPFSKTYDGTNSVIRDSLLLTLPSVIVGDILNFALMPYDSGGTPLGSLSFNVTIEQQADAYTFTGPAAAVGFNLNQTASFTLKWTAFNAASAKLSSTFPGINTIVRNYSTPEVWTNDSVVIMVSNLTAASVLPFTLEAFDQHGTLLNSMSLSVSCVVEGWCDPKDNKVYDFVILNNQMWLSQNYDLDISGGNPPDYADPDGSFYNGDPSNEVPYGRYYQYSTALSNAPDGWRLPTDEDWQGLFAIYGTLANGRYMPGGDTGLNLQAGGGFLNLSFAGLGGSGMYWSHANDPAQVGIITLENGQVYLNDAPVTNEFILLCNVRYVKNS